MFEIKFGQTKNSIILLGNNIKCLIKNTKHQIQQILIQNIKSQFSAVYFVKEKNKKMKKLTHEICLIGCGPVGLTLANCLARSPYIKSIALVDRKIPSIMGKPNIIPSQRVYSINGPSLQIFKSLKIDNRIRQFGIMNEIQVLSKQSQSFVHWNQNQAIIAQNDQINSALISSLKQNPQLNRKVEFIEGEIKNYQVENDSCQVQLSNGQKISTELLVGSDGNRSKVKQLAKIPTYGWSYKQKAIVCTLKIQQQLKDHNKSGYQIYYQGNVFAILPLWENYVSIVWSLNIPEFEHFMGQQDAEFLKSLNNLIQNSNLVLGKQKGYRKIPQLVQIVNKRLSFPLSSLQAGTYTSQRIALVGDAAHSIHPMAGLGVNSGIIDSVLLANNIILSKRTGNDIGQAMSLSSFESKSKSFNYANSIAMETLKKSFEIQHPVFNVARKIGMGLFEQSGLLKDGVKSVVAHNPLISIKPFEWETQ